MICRINLHGVVEKMKPKLQRFMEWLVGISMMKHRERKKEGQK